MVQKEVTKYEYFCCRCRKKINSNVIPIIATENRRKEIDGRLRGYYSFTENVNCLCRKCSGELNAFMKKDYPFESSEREKLLEEKLEEVASEITKDIDFLSRHINVLSQYAGIIDKSVNGSPYLSDADDKNIRKSLRKIVEDFLKDEKERDND